MPQWRTGSAESRSTARTQARWPRSGAGCWTGQISGEHEGSDWATIGSRLDQAPRLTFERVPEPKQGKVRLHLDVQVEDIDAGRAQVENLGGQWTGQRYDYPGEGVVMVMADPEGHEFCLVRYTQG